MWIRNTQKGAQQFLRSGHSECSLRIVHMCDKQKGSVAPKPAWILEEKTQKNKNFIKRLWKKSKNTLDLTKNRYLKEQPILFTPPPQKHIQIHLHPKTTTPQRNGLHSFFSLGTTNQLANTFHLRKAKEESVFRRSGNWKGCHF